LCYLDLPVASDDPLLMLEIILNAILQGTGISAVVPTMMRPDNRKNNVHAVERCRFTPDEIQLLRGALIAGR
jgi:hypothetical protein